MFEQDLRMICFGSHSQSVVALSYRFDSGKRLGFMMKTVYGVKVSHSWRFESRDRKVSDGHGMSFQRLVTSELLPPGRP